jgi:hypothetical protein
VCGVLTDDHDWVYYDVLGTEPGPQAYGTGGWDTPNDPGDPAFPNLWYEPPAGQHNDNGVIYVIVEELYGYWYPDLPRYYPPPMVSRDYAPQVAAVELVLTGSDRLTVTYRTEGAKDVGTKVMMALRRWTGGSYTTAATFEQDIAQKWDNQQSHEFASLASGTYSVLLEIQTPQGRTLYLRQWRVRSGRKTIPL